MAKIEIDNKKMWESILGFQLEGEEAKKFNDLCKYEPFKVTLAFFSKVFKNALKDQGLCYKDGEITAIEPEVKWYVALNDYGHYDNTFFDAVPLFLKGERTTKENVFNMCKDIMGYEITEEEFNKNFRPATEEEIQQTSTKPHTPLEHQGAANDHVESKPEPKKCLFTKEHYTDEERKELCEGCQEEYELNKHTMKEIEALYLQHDLEALRNQAAIAAMQGVMNFFRSLDYNKETIAELAVEQADALIKELRKEK